MPSATAKPAPTAKVQQTITTKEIREPVEKEVLEPSAPAPEPNQDFWGYIATLDPEDWNNHRCDLYRYPLGEMKPQKLGRYIKTYKRGTPLVSEEQILEEFGGGQYDAMLKRDKSLVARHSWEIEAAAKNPAANSGIPAATAAPSELAATLQVVLQNLKQASSAPNAAESPAIKESISLIQQLTQAMPKQQGVGELVSALADLKKLTGGGDGGQNSIIETIKVLKELGIVGGERKSLASEIKEIMEIAGMMGGGGGGGAKRDWVTSLIDNAPTILEKVTPIADKFADAAASNRRVAELRSGVIPAATPTNRPAPALVAPTTAPAAATPAAESPASRVVTMPETEPATPAGAQPQFVAPNLEWVKARAVQLFAAGKPGDAIAEWLDSIDEQLGNFLGSMDAEKFAAFVKNDPILGQIATAPRFQEFVEQFVDYFAAESVNEPSTPV